MKKIVLALALVLVLAPLASALTFTGSLSSPTGVISTGGWAFQGFRLSWLIQDQPDGSWYYRYWLTNAQGNALSPAANGLALELDGGATSANFWGNSGLQIGNLGSFAQFITFDYGASQYSFYSRYAPTWGDFVAKGSHWTTVAFNTGILASDPTGPAADGTLGCKILRPNTAASVVPEPGSMLLMGVGLAGVGVVRRFRK